MQYSADFEHYYTVGQLYNIETCDKRNSLNRPYNGVGYSNCDNT